MEPDNVYPTDGSFMGGVPTEPLDQILERKAERAKTLEAANEIRKVIEHFEDRIAYRDTIEALNIDYKDDPVMHQKKCEVNDMLKMALVEEKEMLEELIDIHSK